MGLCRVAVGLILATLTGGCDLLLCGSPCRATEECAWGQCRQRCEHDDACTAGEICVRGFCEPGSRRPVHTGDTETAADSAAPRDSGSGDTDPEDRGTLPDANSGDVAASDHGPATDASIRDVAASDHGPMSDALLWPDSFGREGTPREIPISLDRSVSPSWDGPFLPEF